MFITAICVLFLIKNLLSFDDAFFPGRPSSGGRGGGAGTPVWKGQGRMLIGKFELHLKENNLGVACV